MNAAAAIRRPGPGPVYAPGPKFPSLWDHTAFWPRKNGNKAKPQAKKPPKGGSKVVKHPSKGRRK